MELVLTYAEMALVRELLGKHRTQLLNGLMKLNPKVKKLPWDELLKLTKSFNEERNPFCEHGLVGRILDRIDAIEQELQLEIKSDVFAPPSEVELKERRRIYFLKREALTALRQIDEYLNVRVNPKFKDSEEYYLCNLVQTTITNIEESPNG